MTQSQLRLEVRMAAQQWVASVMQQYGVPATIMEDALQHVQLSLKDIILQETIAELVAEQAPNQEEQENEDGGSQSDN